MRHNLTFPRRVFYINQFNPWNMLDEKDRDFKGVWIPKEIYLSRACCWVAKMIFIEIHSFTSTGKECFVSNEHLAELFDVSTTQVSKHITKLTKLGWIEQTRFDGRKRYLRACLEVKLKADLPNTPIEAEKAKQPLTLVQSSIELRFKHTIPNTNPITNNDASALPELPHKKIAYTKWTLEQFRDQVHFFKNLYPEKILKEFYNYWKVPDENRTPRFKLERVWSTEYKLEMWQKVENGEFRKKYTNGITTTEKHSGANDLLARTISIVAARREEDTGT